MKTRALIIKKQNTNENDQLVTCYTEDHGKILAIAKSILKKNSIQAMHLDILNLVDFEFVNGRSLPIITGAQAEKTRSNIKGDLKKMAVGYFLLDVLDKMVFENETDLGLWNFANKFLDDLDSGNYKSLAGFFRSSQRKLLELLGYHPQTDICTICSRSLKNEGLALSPETGGLICGQCFLEGNRGVILKKSDIIVLTGAFEWSKDLNFGNSILDVIFENILESRLKSLNFVNNMLK